MFTRHTHAVWDLRAELIPTIELSFSLNECTSSSTLVYAMCACQLSIHGLHPCKLTYPPTPMDMSWVLPKPPPIGPNSTWSPPPMQHRPQMIPVTGLDHHCPDMRFLTYAYFEYAYLFLFCFCSCLFFCIVCVLIFVYVCEWCCYCSY